jgi:hypothetical protein
MATLTKLPDDIEVKKQGLKQLAAWMSYITSNDTSFEGSGTLGIPPDISGEWTNTPSDDSTRRYINLERSFLRQFEKYKDHFTGLTAYFAQEQMKLSAELLLFCAPDSISLQLTGDGSIYYTVRKNDITIYLDHYLVDEFDGPDEAIVSIFKKDEKLLDFGGTLDETMLQLSKVLGPESIVFPSFA